MSSRKIQIALEGLSLEDRKMMVTLGGRIRVCLKVHDWNASTLARRLKINRQTVSKWLKDDVRYIEPKMLFELSDTLDVSARWLSSGKGDMQRGAHLESDEVEILELWRSLPRRDGDELVRQAKQMLRERGITTRAYPYAYTETEKER